MWFNPYRTYKHNSCTRSQIQNLSPSNNGWLSFHLQDNATIIVGLGIPDTINITSDDIVDISEKYASFLVHINNGLMQEEVTKLIHSALENTSDLNKQLFLKNTLYFLPILEKELEKSLTKKYMNNQPVIRPIHVFNHQNKI